MSQQWAEALRRADEVRIWRAEQRGLIKTDVEYGCEVLLSFDKRLETLEIVEFLKWFPGVGQQLAVKMIKRAFVFPSYQTPHRQIRSIDMETCLRLAAELRGYAERVERRRERLAA